MYFRTGHSIKQEQNNTDLKLNVNTNSKQIAAAQTATEQKT
jgi:hypothetical protein